MRPTYALHRLGRARALYKGATRPPWPPYLTAATHLASLPLSSLEFEDLCRCLELLQPSVPLPSSPPSPLRLHLRHRLDDTYPVRSSTSLENRGSVLVVVNLEPPPPNLVADDLSTVPSHISGKHQVWCIVLFLLVPIPCLAMERTAGKGVIGTSLVSSLRGTHTCAPRWSHLSASSALRAKWTPTWHVAPAPAHL